MNYSYHQMTDFYVWKKANQSGDLTDYLVLGNILWIYELWQKLNCFKCYFHLLWAWTSTLRLLGVHVYYLKNWIYVYVPQKSGYLSLKVCPYFLYAIAVELASSRNLSIIFAAMYSASRQQIRSKMTLARFNKIFGSLIT